MRNDTISIASVVSAKSGMPFVQLKWGAEGCQMTPDEARQHAYGILDAANAAETDSIMLRFLMDKVGLTMEQVAPMLQEFRKLREQKQAVLPDGAHRHNRT